MIEAAFSDGTGADISAVEPMMALLQYIEKHTELKVLNEVNILNGVVESDQFDAVLKELQSINCKGDCPVVTNLIGAIQSAIDNDDEWVMFV